MCCLLSLLCQHHQRRKFAYRNHRSAVAKLCLFFGALLLNLSLVSLDEPEIASYLSELRVQELHNIAIRLEHSIDEDKYACESYFDYVCGLNHPLFTIMGHLPDINELIQLLTELQEDAEQFEAKQKLMDFFISCNSHKSLEDCYRETFEYFKPIFGYLVSKNYLDNSPEHRIFLDILERFVDVAQQNRKFRQASMLPKLITLKNDYKYPQTYFRAAKLNSEYEPLKVYRGSYQHNIKNLELFRRRNSTYEIGIYKTVLDWTLYLYQSRNKPISYYYPTLSAHLWMSVYNSSDVRDYEPKQLAQIGECLKFPQFVNVLEEARILAIVYFKSFNSAWKDYKDWIAASEQNKLVYELENKILLNYQLSNDKLFFTLYGQNFCEFGRDLAENVFYVGIQQSMHFSKTYSCDLTNERNYNCL